jgi:hypothetical protein
MVTTLRQALKRAGLILAITLTGCTVALHAVPAARASDIVPAYDITTSAYEFSTNNSDAAALDVSGANFSPGYSVMVEVFDSTYHLAAARTVTTSTTPSCTRVGVQEFCTTGDFYAAFEFTSSPRFQTVHVIARDNATGAWSNWSSVYVP